MLTLIAAAFAATLAGVTMSDTATVGGQTIQLNGLGLREKLTFDIYVGALYLQHKTTSGSTAISADEPKKIVMHFVYGSGVSKEKLLETFNESFAKQGAAATAQQANIDKLLAWMPDVMNAGEEISIEYVPGTGTTVKVKGATKGTIAGADFMKILWTVYLGPNPPTAALKSGMLGG